MKKILKGWRAVRRDDDMAVDPGAQAAAAITAYHAALAEHGLEPDSQFSLCTVADSDGDGDLGDSSALLRVSDRYADWYILCTGSTAEVVAFWAYPWGAEWADEELFAYSETSPLAKAFAGAQTAEAPAARADRDAWLVELMNGEQPPAEVAKAYRPIAKDDTQRYTLGVAYPHSELDSHGDFTDEQELEQAAWGFMRSVIAKGEGGVGTDHADGTDDAAQVVESYIYRGPDWSIDVGDGETVVVKSGDWMVGAVWSEDVWPRVEKGDDITGWSIQGLAVIDPDATLEA